MDYDGAVEFMSGRLQFGIKLGNERFSALMDRLGNPQREYRVAHIAGTKGKGSTTAMIASILREHGFRVGGYYSPYVYDLCERIQIDGANIARDDFAKQVTEVAPHLDAIERAGLGETTEFELKTAVGFRYFADQKIDFASVEVGLGGRLDATNVVEPSATVITNIGLDHTHILGDTHAKIAFEKAGVIKRGIPVITATEDPDAISVIKTVALERDAPLIYVTDGPEHVRDENRIHYLSDNGTVSIFTLHFEYRELRLGLQGYHQYQNAACAVGAIEALSKASGFVVDPAKVRQGLARASLPGRFEIRRQNPTLILDGAHNAMAGQALVDELSRWNVGRLLLVVGMTAGHGPEDFLRPFASAAHRVFATQPEWHKAQPAEEIAAAAANLGIKSEVIHTPKDAALAALEYAEADDVVLVTGSFYVVGDLPPGSI